MKRSTILLGALMAIQSPPALAVIGVDVSDTQTGVPIPSATIDITKPSGVVIDTTSSRLEKKKKKEETDLGVSVFEAIRELEATAPAARAAGTRPSVEFRPELEHQQLEDSGQAIEQTEPNVTAPQLEFQDRIEGRENLRLK